MWVINIQITYYMSAIDRNNPKSTSTNQVSYADMNTPLIISILYKER